MKSYGSWSERVVIEGESFLVDSIDQNYAARAGLSKIIAVKGLPVRFEEDLVRAAQVCDVPHTWRVRQCSSEDEVDEDLLTRGKEVLANDRVNLGVNVVTYLGQREKSDNGYEFLAAGAIRNKLSRSFQSDEFPVVSRAIVAPKHRGNGIGTLIVEHRVKAVIRGFFPTPPKAIHFGTESEKVLQSIKKVEREEGVTFVYIGEEQYTTSDGTHTVHDYLCYLPGYRESLLRACDDMRETSNTPFVMDQFKSGLDTFMSKGINGITGRELEALSRLAIEGVVDSPKANAATELIGQVFQIRTIIGAQDPSV